MFEPTGIQPVQSAVWSERFFGSILETFIPLCFRALNNSIWCSRIKSLLTHDIVPLSMFISPIPRILIKLTYSAQDGISGYLLEEGHCIANT